MGNEFNNYPTLEKEYADTCWENHRRDMDLIDKIVENYIKMCKSFRKHRTSHYK